ncbi:MAG TPA: VOC family protein [Hyphomicrobium sp.]|nr:VOC family protein [Hyphomicrobium sp.]
MTKASPPFDRTKIVVPLAIPILASTDLERASKTYAAAGFEVIRPAPDYAILRRAGVELHMSKVSFIPEPHCIAAYIRVDDADTWFAAFESADVNKRIAPKDKPWGLREAHIIDLDGNLVTIGQPLA